MPTKARTLERLSQTGLMLADPKQDIRGHTVLDQEGEKVGKVDDLLVDDERKVRLLEVGSGGFLSLGREQTLVPVDAIAYITEDQVQLIQTREHIGNSPHYSPEVVSNEEFYRRIYAHFGYEPYWSVGYLSPVYPYYRRPKGQREGISRKV